MKIDKLPVRKAEVRRESRTVYRFAQQRTFAHAARLSNLARAKASAEVANEALHAVIVLAYETLPDGSPVNVDSVTGDMLISVPWSAKNYAAFGLRRSEADILRAYLMRLAELASKGEKAPPLFTYDPLARRWALNRADYPTFETAEAWLRRYQMSPQGWLKWADWLRKKRRQWYARLRKE